MDIAKKIVELTREQETLLANYHRVSGAIAMLKQILEEKPEERVKALEERIKAREE